MSRVLDWEQFWVRYQNEMCKNVFFCDRYHILIILGVWNIDQKSRKSSPGLFWEHPWKRNKIARAKIILLYTICQGCVESQMGLSKSVPRWSILLWVFGGSEGLWGLVRESSWWGRSCLQGFLCLTIQPADLSSNPFDYLKFMTINSSCMEPIGHNPLISV